MLPDMKYFMQDNMHPKQREEFEKWYVEMRDNNYSFNLKTDPISYCKNDVTILGKAIIKFDQIIYDQVGVHPFKKCFTLLSLTMAIFRKKYLMEIYEVSFKYRGTNDLINHIGYQCDGVIKLDIGNQMVEVD